jgi:hypothetical protein
MRDRIEENARLRSYKCNGRDDLSELFETDNLGIRVSIVPEEQCVVDVGPCLPNLREKT